MTWPEVAVLLLCQFIALPMLAFPLAFASLGMAGEIAAHLVFLPFGGERRKTKSKKTDYRYVHPGGIITSILVAGACLWASLILTDFCCANRKSRIVRHRGKIYCPGTYCGYLLILAANG